VAFIFNFILVLSLFAIMADSKQKTRGDLHYITAFGSFLSNIIFVAVCTIWYFFYTNKTFSGTQPTNDPRWCCNYFMINLGLCPNNSPCIGGPVNITPDAAFILHWIFSGIFLVVTFFHIGINRLIRTTKIIPKRIQSVEEAKFFAICICWVYLGLFVFWAIFALWNTIIMQFYDYQWFFLYFLCLNILPPILMLLSMNFPNSLSINSAFFWLTVLVIIISFASLLVFLGVWGFDCNNNLFLNSDQSICNDYKYCCQAFDVSPNQCDNVTPCPYYANLNPNPEFVQHMVFAFVFSMAGTVLVWINYRLKAYGYFKKPT
jgi:hypothetical protein